MEDVIFFTQTQSIIFLLKRAESGKSYIVKTKQQQQQKKKDEKTTQVVSACPASSAQFFNT